MVAISLYRGNLHRVPPDLPRRWLMPTPAISLKSFRSLLFRRSKALSLLPSSSSSVFPAFNFSPLAVPTPNPFDSALPNQSRFKAVENPNPVDDAGHSAPLGHSTLLVDEVVEKLVAEKGREMEVSPVVDYPIPPAFAGTDKVDTEEKEKLKREVEEKLLILNEKKHNLVQALKQILNAEEELKRRSSMQASRPPLPLQVDVSIDSGSMTRHATPRTGSEANLIVDVDGGETEDAVNNNPQSRQLLRMTSTSPSVESAFRRVPSFQHNTAFQPSRAAFLAAGSPSRFAPSGNQSYPSNFPTVSVTGTNYFASSPSPAASGGTSGFRDTRHQSPRN